MTKEKVISRLDGYVEFFLCALIFALPFSKSMIEVCFGCAFALWVIKRFVCYWPKIFSRETFKAPKTDLNLPIGVLMLAGLLSTAASASLLLSLEGFFFKLFEGVMIYFIIAETINSWKRLNRILAVMFFSMALMVVDGIFQLITGSDFIRNYSAEWFRMRSSFGNSNSFAGWLVVMIPLALSLAWFGKIKRIMRLALWILTGLLIVCLSLTYSRGAWIASALSLIFIGILKRKKLGIVIIIVLLGLSFFTTHFIIEYTAPFKISRSPIGERPDLWWSALKIIRDFPFIGSGLNTYTIIAGSYMPPGKGAVYPHNSYLHMAAETGILGLGIFLWLIAALFRTSLANLKRMRDSVYSAVLIGALAGLFGFFAHSFVDVNMYSLQLVNLMYFMMGLAVAVQKISLPPDQF